MMASVTGTHKLGQIAALLMEVIERHHPEGEVTEVGIVVEVEGADGSKTVESRTTDKADPVRLFDQAADQHRDGA